MNVVLIGEEAARMGTLQALQQCDVRLAAVTAWGVPRIKRGNSTLGILKARLAGAPGDAPPGAVGTERSGGVEVACADEWIPVRQLFRGGVCIPPREALKAGDRLADA